MARFNTSSGVKVSKVNVSCNAVFFFQDINRSLTNSSSKPPNLAVAAWAVKAASKDSNVSPDSCALVTNLYLSYVMFFVFSNDTLANLTTSLNSIFEISMCGFFCTNFFFPSVPNAKKRRDVSRF